MFIGTYNCSVDAKGRLMFPAKFREELNGDTFYISMGLDGQIDIYTSSKWEAILNRLSQYDDLDFEANELKRYILGSTQSGEFDAQGRVNLNAFKVSVGLNKKATVIGMGDKIEIWATEVLEERNKDQSNIRNTVRKLLNKS